MVSKPVNKPAVFLISVAWIAAAGETETLGGAEETDNRIKIMNMQIKREQTALFLIEEPAILDPGRTGRKSFKISIQGFSKPLTINQLM